MKYFHELTKKDYDALVEEGTTFRELEKLHPQPDWCEYPHATRGFLGCWGLMAHKIKSKKDCGTCDMIKDNQ